MRTSTITLELEPFKYDEKTGVPKHQQFWDEQQRRLALVHRSIAEFLTIHTPEIEGVGDTVKVSISITH